jgi:transcriptional regulator with XRE-family HTH domain
MHFAEWVTMRRKALGLSQSEIAERANVHQSVWSEYENPDRKAQPRRSTVLKIANALGLPHEDALEAAGYIAKSPEVPAEVVSMWQRAKRAGKECEMLRAWRATVDLVASA